MQGFSAVVPQAIALSSTDAYNLSQSFFYFRGEEWGRNGACFSDLGELEQSDGHVASHHNNDAVNIIRRSVCGNDMKASNVSVVSSNLKFDGLNNNLVSAEMVTSRTDSGQFTLQKGTMMGGEASSGALENGQFEKNWGELGADRSQQTDISTDSDDKNQYPGVHNERLIAATSRNQYKGKIGDQKALRRLAQNRESARKSRMRKRAYVQQLEDSQLRLSQLEQELKRARKQQTKMQGNLVTSEYFADHSYSVAGNGALEFDTEYARWFDEHQQLINDLRSGVSSDMDDGGLKPFVDKIMSHYDEIFLLKRICVKSDVFHLLSGKWKTPAERCFMWLGGFRSSVLLKILGNQIQPLTEQQQLGIGNLKQSSQQTEDALSQGMEALHQSFIDSLSLNYSVSCNSGNITDYMGQMKIAMNNLATLEDFVHQADLLRQKTLQQLQRILTSHQAARALLAINDFQTRLRALSLLWSVRPKE